jgi:hypothetical protein
VRRRRCLIGQDPADASSRSRGLLRADIRENVRD